MANSRLLSAIKDCDDLLLMAAFQKRDEGALQDSERFVFAISNARCKKLFRFEKNDLSVLCDALNLPEFFQCANRTACSGIEGICLLLRRLAYPNRLEDLQPLFGRSETGMSFIINEVLDYIHETHGHLLIHLRRTWLNEHQIQRFADAVHAKGGPLTNCWGFIDGTVRPFCRPSENQRVVFNGYKRVHALKFQSGVTPNELIANMFGPIEGHRHDSGMLRESELQEQLHQNMNSQNGQTFVLYGDPAYPLTPYIQTPYRGGAISANLAKFNKKMSEVRICDSNGCLAKF